MPSSEEQERAFGMPDLRAFLGSVNFVPAHIEKGSMSADLTEVRDTTIEMNIELGESIYESSYDEATVDPFLCQPYIHAPARIRVLVGASLLYFEADGVFSRRKDDVSARLYFEADLATAVGTFRPRMDTSRIHGGGLEASFAIAPGRLRGDLYVVAYHFDDEAQYQRFNAGDWQARDRELLIQFSSPDDECFDQALPFPHDIPIDLLHGQTGEELRARVARLVGEWRKVRARWRDGSETELTLEFGPTSGGTLCLERQLYIWPRVQGRALKIPVSGRIYSDDLRIDVPISALSIAVDEDNEIRVARFSGAIVAAQSDVGGETPESDADQVGAQVLFNFDGAAFDLDGIVEFRESVEPEIGSDRRVDCIAFPLGSPRDLADCRYQEEVQ